MKLRWKILTGVATAFLVVSLTSTPLLAVDGYDRGPQGFGQHGHGFDGHRTDHPGAHIKRLLKRLDLSVEQREQVQSIFEQSKPQMRALHESRRSNHDRLMAVTPDDPDYGAVVAEVSQSNAALAEQKTLLRARVQSDIWAILTDAQKERAGEIRQEMRERMQRKIDEIQQRLDATR